MPRLYASPAIIQQRTSLERQATALLRRAARRPAPRPVGQTAMQAAYEAALRKKQ
jgi:hypothetical protein